MTREQLKEQIRVALADELDDARRGYKTHEAFLFGAIDRLFGVIVDALFDEGEKI
ncbi:hypothetical protein [Sphingobium sp. LSP13-1-1.1]|uniref:hypothetical protein n=1 Tax=Sphingobium sp. LSP13-1-1.1 TaxID=3135234 RepID=UPI00343DB4E6